MNITSSTLTAGLISQQYEQDQMVNNFPNDLARVAFVKTMVPLSQQTKEIMITWHHLTTPEQSNKILEAITSDQDGFKMKRITSKHTFPDENNSEVPIEILVTEVVQIVTTH